MPGLALSRFFFPSSSPRSRRSKARTSRSRPVSINISKNSGANIYPCIWMGYPSPPAPLPSTEYREEQKDDPIAMSQRFQRHVLLSPPPINPWNPSRSGQPNEGAVPLAIPVTSHVPKHRRTRPARQANHQGSDGDVSEAFLQFPNHWDQVVQSRTCFVPQPQDASTDSQPGGHRRSAPLPDAIVGRALHFCVVDRTGGAWPATSDEREYILTCSVGGVAAVLSGLAPEGSGRRINVVCHTPCGEEYGGIDLLDAAVSHGWPFMIMIDEQE